MHAHIIDCQAGTKILNILPLKRLGMFVRCCGASTCDTTWLVVVMLCRHCEMKLGLTPMTADACRTVYNERLNGHCGTVRP